MFRWIIGSSLQFRFAVVGIAAAMVVFGATQLPNTPVDVFPEFDFPVVEIQTEANGLSAEEVASLITLNLEELLAGVPWLRSIRSESVDSLSSIVLTYERGTEVIKARQMIQERLTQAFGLPNVSNPPAILQPLSTTSRFMMIAVTSEEVEATALSNLARWKIKPKLVGVQGVANVAIWGLKLRQLHVQIDQERLRDARLTQADIIAAAGDAMWVTPLSFLRGSAPGTGGWVDNRNQRLGVHHKMPIVSPEDMAKVAIPAPNLVMAGVRMSLGDVAEVTYSSAPSIGGAFVNGGSGLLLVVEKLPSANTLEVTREVEAAMAELSQGLPGVEIDTTVFRLASYVEDSIFNLTRALILGGLLVVVVLGAFLFNWRSALISALSIPASLLAALIVLNLTGVTINTMILAGLIVALGVIVDDAVVDVERLMGRLRERRDGSGKSIGTIIYETTLETRSVMIYATLIVVLAVVPIFFMGGLSGAFFEPLAISYLLAVAASMVIALTLTPALSLILLGKASHGFGDSPIAVWLRERYDSGLRVVLKAPRIVFGAALVVVVAGAVAWPLLGQSLLPSLKEGALVVNWTTPPGTSSGETYRITSRVSRELQTLPGVSNVAAQVGRAIEGDQVVGINSSQIWVKIDPDADFNKMIAAVRRTVEGYPGVDSNVQTYLRSEISGVLTGVGDSIVVRIYGQQDEILRQKAEEVRQALSGIPGIVDLRADILPKEPQVVVKVDLDRAGRLNVKPGDVRRSSATQFSGLTVGFLFEEQRIMDVVVMGAPETRRSLSDIRDVLVEKSDRHHVRLGDVADVSIVQAPTNIRHDRVSPYIDVVANVVGRDLGSVGREVERRLQEVEWPLEYHPELLGEFVERQEAQQRVLGIGLAALLGIFLLLQACFRSWRLALIAFLAVPVSVAGGVLAALVSGGVISLGSVVGLLAVLGLATRSGVLLINHYQRLAQQEDLPFGLDLVLRGARERLSAILGSSIAIIAALSAIVVFGQIPGLEIAQPTAIVMIGGIVASALFTLFVIPALFLVFGSGTERQPDLGLADA